MNRRLKILIVFCGLLGLLALFGRGPISRSITFQLLIRQDAPSELAISEVLDNSTDPTHRIQNLWNSGRIPHRHIALRYIKEHSMDQTFPLDRVKTLAWAALRDPDFSNRELALGILSETDLEKLISILPILLLDRDQAFRLRVLRLITDVEDKIWIPVFLELLDDPDPIVVAQTAAKLRRWTGKDFGIRMIHAIAANGISDPKNPNDITPDQKKALTQGVISWKKWRSEQPDQLEETKRVLADYSPDEPAALRVEDFKIETIKGETLKLSDFRGKAVLLNFWTTWCASCMTEMPDLNWLHDQYPSDLQVIGISLDGDDGHGHEHSSIVDIEEALEKGWDAVHAEYGDSTGSHDHDHEHTSKTSGPDLVKIKKKIQRVIRKKELKYPVAMDPFSKIGKRFNGQELPTNILIDAEGKLRRRFVGARPIHSWQAMLHEIGVPAPKIP